MELQHTPGPWALKNYNGYDAYKSHVIYVPNLSKKPNNENYIAKVNWFPYDGVHADEVARGQANAQLIQYAPEMAHALIDVRRRIMDALIPEGFEDQFDQITEVLSKAIMGCGINNPDKKLKSDTHGKQCNI